MAANTPVKISPARITAFLLSILCLSFIHVGQVYAQSAPALVVYGPGSPTKEGDPDYQQEIYITVPAYYKGRLYVRLFDPDTNHGHDTHYGVWEDTRTKFMLFGGDGADKSGGKLLATRSYGSNRRLDNRWSTFTSFKPKQGLSKAGVRLFRLDIKGLRGDDGNIFDVTVSRASNRNIPVTGVRIYTFQPTVRVLDDKVLTELRFKIPANASTLTFHNFDAARAEIKFVHTFTSSPLAPSNQDDWARPKVQIAKQDRGTMAAVTVRLGEELPNDVTMFITDQVGNNVPIELPIRSVLPNTKPVAAQKMIPQTCRVMRFDASGSRDPDGHKMSYLWRFHDGTLAGGKRVEHSFATPGKYRARLEVRDSSGLVGNGTALDFAVIVKARPIARINIPAIVARGLAAQFDATRSTTGAGYTIGTFIWDFGDGTTGTGPKPSHTYARPGKYLVRLTVKDTSNHPCDTGTQTFNLTVNADPIAAAGQDRVLFIGQTFLFDGSKSVDPDGRLTQYIWDFGDNSKGTGVRRPHTYWKKGTYRVKLTVVDNSGLGNDRHTDEVIVKVTDAPNLRPIANAGPDRLVIVGEKITFDGSASKDRDGSLSFMKWDFGNGDTALGAAPVYAYARAGSYKVTLYVKDASGLDNNSHAHAITVIVKHRPNLPAKPVAGLDVSAAIGETVAFDASQTTDRDSNIIRYDWDFGDGSRGLGIKSSHAYAKSGLYTVTLRVTDSSGRPNAQTTDTRLVRVNQPPVANAGPNQIVTSSEVRFDATASKDLDGVIASYVWNFGDGTIGKTANPVHVYRKPGTYKVTLTVSDASGTIRNSHTAPMRVIVNATPIADAGRGVIAAPGEKISFNGGNSVDPDGEVKNWRWDFRDGSQSQGKIVEHSFSKPGTYMVRLKIMDNTGHKQAVDFAETKVVINERPVANAGPDIRAAPGDEIIFNGAQSFDRDGKIMSFRWDFPDRKNPVAGARIKRTFKTPGLYKVQLSVADNANVANSVAKDEINVAVNHAPVAVAGKNIISSQLRVVFDASGSADADGDGLTYKWDFGDGTKAHGVRVTHTYKTGGKFPVILKVNDGTGLKNAGAVDTLTVAINRVPVAIAGKNRNVCTGDVVVFDASASSDPEKGVLRYSWTFGDGTKSAIVNPTKKYSKPGNFPVTLTVQDDSGLKNSNHSDRIYVRVNQAPVADAGPDILACTHVPVKFNGTKSFDLDGVVNRYSWDFGDGTLGGGDRPRHSYSRPGTYRVSLNIEGDQIGQCSATANDQLQVRVIEAPVARIKAVKATPLGASTVFDGSSSSDKNGKITGWHWDFGDGTTGTGARVNHAFTKPGRYRVTLTIKSATAAPACRSISIAQDIVVNAPPVAQAGQDIEISVGQEVRFDGAKSHDSDGGIKAFVWNFGDGSVGTGLQPVHAFAKPGRYLVKLTVKDISGLKNDTASDTLNVIVKAAAKPPILGPHVACVSDPVTWQANLGDGVAPDGRKLTWLLGDGTRSNKAKLVHRYQRAGKFMVTLFVDENNILANSARHLTRTLHVNAPPTALAGPDQLGCAGTPISFDASASSDLDGKISAVKWDFGDGKTSSKLKPRHLYQKPGTYLVTLSVRDDAKSSCSVSTDTLKVVINAPPKANAGRDIKAFIGGANDAILFDGTKSSDPDGNNLSYQWHVGKGLKLSGARAKHLFTRSGDVAVKLTISDGTGLACGIAHDTMIVKVRQRGKN